MSVKTLQIDGKMVTGPEGDSIFTVAWESGIHIPRLCHIGGLTDVGACRLCLVEIEGQRRLQASCLTPVQEGMVVRTDTDKLRAHRKLIVELLMAERNHVCAVCVANGDCELQDLAMRLGIDHLRVRYQFPTAPRRSHATSVSDWIITAASSVRAAFAFAMKSRARIPGTWPDAAPDAA